MTDEHTHEFVLIAIRPDGTRIYGCVGCQKTKTHIADIAVADSAPLIFNNAP